MIRIESAASTHVGRVRQNNQDRALVAGQLAAVADGMGGHAGGDKAAALAIAELSGVRGTISAERLIKVVQGANQRIFKVGLAPELRGMGTTVVAAIVDNSKQIMSMINVGDSRGYMLRDGVFSQVTNDHSLVEDLLRSGRLTEDEAKVHPQRNIVTRVLGISEEVDVDLFTIEVQVGDRFVLCSDGLTNEVTDEDIVQILQSNPSITTCVDELVTTAVTNGGRDNVTVAVVDILMADSGDDSLADRVDTAASAMTNGDEVPEVRPSGLPTEEFDVSLLADKVATSGDASEGVGIPADYSAEVGDPDGIEGSGVEERTTLSQPSEGSESDGIDEPKQAPRVEDAGPADDGWKLQQTAQRSRRPKLSYILAVALIAIIVAVILGQRYADSYYADELLGEVVIMHGRPDGVLWDDPDLVEHTNVLVQDLNGRSAEDVANKSPWPSLDEARSHVAKLEQDSEQVAGG